MGPAAGFAPDALPAVKFALKSKKKDGTEVPKTVTRFQSKRIPILCPTGEYYFLDDSASADFPSGFFEFNADIRVKKNQTFSGYEPISSDGPPSSEGQ